MFYIDTDSYPNGVYPARSFQIFTNDKNDIIFRIQYSDESIDYWDINLSKKKELSYNEGFVYTIVE